MNTKNKQKQIYVIYYFTNCFIKCLFVFDAITKKEITNEEEEVKSIFEAIKSKKYKRISVARTQNAFKIKLII